MQPRTAGKTRLWRDDGRRFGSALGPDELLRIAEVSIESRSICASIDPFAPRRLSSSLSAPHLPRTLSPSLLRSFSLPSPLHSPPLSPPFPPSPHAPAPPIAPGSAPPKAHAPHAPVCVCVCVWFTHQRRR